MLKATNGSSTKISFFIAGNNHHLLQNDGLWLQTLPAETNCSLTYGDYFQAAHDFLIENQFEPVRSAVYQQAGRQLVVSEITSVSISLEKHGRFYHPAKVEVMIEWAESPFYFVLNVALTATACVILVNEYQFLKKLDALFQFQFVPCVYALHETSTSGKKVCMFLGEWFDGYLEFHLSMDENQNTRIIVWNYNGDHFYLTKAQEQEVYKRATYILTCFYNLFSFEQIFPWHHAAGDFVLKIQHGIIDLKLITIRQYATMVEISEETEFTVIENLLLFFLNLTIRMRLDRLNGTGNIVWSNDYNVESILKGFFEALLTKKNTSSHVVIERFFSILSVMSESDLLNITSNILDSYHPNAPEIPIINTNQISHIRLIRKYIPAFI